MEVEGEVVVVVVVVGVRVEEEEERCCEAGRECEEGGGARLTILCWRDATFFDSAGVTRFAASDLELPPLPYRCARVPCE